MAAAGLPRSATSFRRQGSSGLVWDDKFLSGDLKRMTQADDKDKADIRPSQTVMMQRSRSEGGGRRTYRTIKAPSPAVDPPSPKVSGCGLCGFFGKQVEPHKPRPNHKPNKRKS